MRACGVASKHAEEEGIHFCHKSNKHDWDLWMSPNWDKLPTMFVHVQHNPRVVTGDFSP